ncbi:MAG TPA: TonB-dependent receptor [Steroidobacteraceae bacterium]|nr:TonB-dependent receptor [Steroidobacteraceae bacterium]
MGAQATQAAADNGQDAAGGGTSALQEVVVTAERRATDIQTTPISVVAVSGNQLASQNMTAIGSLQVSTPSFQVDNDGLYGSANIRGIGNQAITPDITTGIAVLKDGLFSPETHGLSDPFYDIHDVEVLRGPQGTFIGYSSTGGAVEITTENPNLRGFNGYIEGQVGNYSDKKFDTAVNLPLSDTLAVRIALNEEQEHSFYRDIGSLVEPAWNEPLQDPGQIDNKDARISALWKPTDNFQALLKLEWNSANQGGTAEEPNQLPFTLPPGATGCPSGGAGPTCHSEYYGYSSHIPYVLNYTPSAANSQLPALFDPFYDYRTGLELRYTLPDGIVLRSLTGFQQTQYNTGEDGCDCDADAGAFYQWIPRDDYYSEEINLISPSNGPLTWIAGASWFYRDTGVTVSSINSFTPFSPVDPELVKINDDILNRIMGLFGQASWQFTHTLQLQAGLRGNWDNNFSRGPVDEVGIPGEAGAPGYAACNETSMPSGYGCFNEPTTGGYTDSVPTGKVTLNWTPAQGQFFYLFYARGYKSGGYVAGATAPYDPEHINDYELGWKGTMLDGHLQTAVGGYWMNYQNMQQVIYNPANGQGNQIVNLGSSTLRGIEASADARVGGLGIDFTGDYEKSSLGNITTVANYALPPGTANLPQCVGGATSGCFNYDPYEVNVSGESDIFAPDLQGTLSLDYRIPVGNGTLDPKVQYSYTAKQYASLFQIPYFEMGARHIYDAYLTYDVGHWDTEAYITNFTNEVYLNGNNGATVFYGVPRQVGVRVRRDF